MKRFVCIIFLTFTALLAFGQNNGALKFLGIPIDGAKVQFASKLKAKGFTYNSYSDSYKGQFNGKPVDIYIHTNHELVDRIYVAFPSTVSEATIKNEYNTLLSQFENSDKYSSFIPNEEIPYDEDISYEMSVNNKRYEGSFYYMDPDRDKEEFSKALVNSMSDILSPEQADYYLRAVSEFYAQSEEEQKDIISNLPILKEQFSDLDSELMLKVLIRFMYSLPNLADGCVWFTIHENYGRYNIGIYYDNLHNKAHGEDL
jgi:hypothetical protein